MGQSKNRRDNQLQSLLILYKLINGLVDVHIPECMVNNSSVKEDITDIL